MSIKAEELKAIEKEMMEFEPSKEETKWMHHVITIITGIAAASILADFLNYYYGG